MIGNLKRMSKKVGLPPTALVHVGEERFDPVKLSVLRYNSEGYEEKILNKPEEIVEFKGKPGITWVKVDGVHDAGIIREIGEIFHLHPLVLEDIMNTEHRPKMDEFDEYIFLVIKIIIYDEDNLKLRTEQVSLIFGDSFVITFSDSSKSLFNNVEEGIRKAKGNIREMGSDYLAFVCLDIIVDHYYVILEQLGEDIEAVEEDLVKSSSQDDLIRIHVLKRNMLLLRKSIWPLREVIGSLGRGNINLIQNSTMIYFRDVYDHTIQVIDTTETFREVVSGMLDIYLSGINNRMNEIMKVLTVIATIFIPLTFLTGIYGMNFKHFPELEWRWGFYLNLGVMGVIVGIMVIFFKLKKWL